MSDRKHISTPANPHLYTGNPRDPYCARCHMPIRLAERECHGKDLIQ